jgi:hypothetical protein
VRPLALAVAILIFGLTHHIVFRNACHYNTHTVYYLLPTALLLGTAIPVLAYQVLRWWAPTKLAAALVVILMLAPIFVINRDAKIQAWDYFNAKSFSGWPLAGMALNAAIPAGERLVAGFDLSNPQFLFYLWRGRRNNFRDPKNLPDLPAGTYLLTDLNYLRDDPFDTALALYPSQDFLNLSLARIGGRRDGAMVSALSVSPGAWESSDHEFGEYARLLSYQFGPRVISAPDRSRVESFLGIRWTPSTASGRIVHAGFAWERTGSEAGKLTPEYELQRSRGPGVWRVAPMWRLQKNSVDLGRFGPGEIVRHEVSWFIGEWMPPGEYNLVVRLRKDDRPVRPTIAGKPARLREIVLGTIIIDAIP